MRDRQRTAYNMALLQVALGDCREAAAQKEILAEPLADPSLQPLVDQLDGLIERCGPTGWVVLDCRPADAEVTDGNGVIGLVRQPIELPAGPHILTVQAPGYASHMLEVDVIADDTTVLGPIDLISLDEGRWVDRVTWYEWTLWGSGLAGIGAGVGYLLWARDREAQLEALQNDGLIIIDRDGEEDTIRRLRSVGGGFLALGVVAVTAGTVLHLRGDSRNSSGSAPQADVGWLDGPRVLLRWSF